MAQDRRHPSLAALTAIKPSHGSPKYRQMADALDQSKTISPPTRAFNTDGNLQFANHPLASEEERITLGSSATFEKDKSWVLETTPVPYHCFAY